MIGYKIAIGVSEKHGFFTVMVELEIPEDATIVKPLFGIHLADKNYGFVLITKYRTNICKVVKVYPLDNKSYDDWNRNAFSIYELTNWYTDIQTVYKVGNTISINYVDEDVKHDCGAGIHFFGSYNDAEKFYNGEGMIWANRIVSILNGTVVAFGKSGVLCMCRNIIKKLCLSFE